MRLVCIHHAGASSLAFHSWLRAAQDFNFEVIPLEFPGRGRRTNEKLLTKTDALLGDLSEQAITSVLSGPYVLFGHSFGALLAYELALRIEEMGLPAPTLLAVSGANPPHRLTLRNRHNLSNEELLAYVSRYGGVDVRIAENSAASDYVVNVLRADYQALENFDWHDRGKVTALITTILSDDDPAIDIHAMHEWGRYGMGECQPLRLRAAGHLYLATHRDEILAHLAMQTARAAPSFNLPKATGESHDTFH